MSKTKITGSIRPRPTKDNIRYFDIILELGVNPLTGQRERPSFRCDSTDWADAEEMLILKKAEFLSGELIKPSNLTVEEFMKIYVSDYASILAESTVRTYEGAIYTYIIPEFGKIKLQALKRERIQQVYNQWRKKSPAGEKPLRAETIKHINRTFKAALNVAVELGYLKENPTRGIKIPKDSVTEEIEVFTTEEIKKLFRAVQGTDMELPVALLFDGVLRRGELLGLAFGDVDYEAKTITVRHSWVETKDSKVPILKDTKTSSSFRVIPVSDTTIRLIKRQELHCKAICLRQGKPFTKEQRIVCKEDGTPYLPKSFTRKWARTLKVHGIRHIKLHGTRHSAISWLLSQGVPVHIVQERAGHQDPKITLKVYSHVAKDNKRVVAELLDEKLFRASNE